MKIVLILLTVCFAVLSIICTTKVYSDWRDLISAVKGQKTNPDWVKNQTQDIFMGLFMVTSLILLDLFFFFTLLGK